MYVLFPNEFYSVSLTKIDILHLISLLFFVCSEPSEFFIRSFLFNQLTDLFYCSSTLLQSLWPISIQLTDSDKKRTVS